MWISEAEIDTFFWLLPSRKNLFIDQTP